jgi:hypothetical protein
VIGYIVAARIFTSHGLGHSTFRIKMGVKPIGSLNAFSEVIRLFMLPFPAVACKELKP